MPIIVPKNPETFLYGPVMFNTWSNLWRMFTERVAAVNRFGANIPYVRIVSTVEPETNSVLVRDSYQNVMNNPIERYSPMNKGEIWQHFQNTINIMSPYFLMMWKSKIDTDYSEYKKISGQVPEFLGDEYDATPDLLGGKFGAYYYSPTGTKYILNPISGARQAVYSGGSKVLQQLLPNRVNNYILGSSGLRQTFEDEKYGEPFIAGVGRSIGEQFGPWIIEDSVKILNGFRNIIFYPNERRERLKSAFIARRNSTCDISKKAFLELWSKTNIVKSNEWETNRSYNYVGEDLYEYQSSAPGGCYTNPKFQAFLRHYEYRFNQYDFPADIGGEAYLYGASTERVYPEYDNSMSPDGVRNNIYNEYYSGPFSTDLKLKVLARGIAGANSQFVYFSDSMYAPDYNGNPLSPRHTCPANFFEGCKENPSRDMSGRAVVAFCLFVPSYSYELSDLQIGGGELWLP